MQYEYELVIQIKKFSQDTIYWTVKDEIDILPSLVPGFEISDVLKIDDKDYSITFGLYFR